MRQGDCLWNLHIWIFLSRSLVHLDNVWPGQAQAQLGLFLILHLWNKRAIFPSLLLNTDVLVFSHEETSYCIQLVKTPRDLLVEMFIWSWAQLAQSLLILRLNNCSTEGLNYVIIPSFINVKKLQSVFNRIGHGLFHESTWMLRLHLFAPIV